MKTWGRLLLWRSLTVQNGRGLDVEIWCRIILRLRNILGRKTGHQGKVISKYFPKGIEVLNDIENYDAIKAGNIDEEGKNNF